MTSVCLACHCSLTSVCHCFLPLQIVNVAWHCCMPVRSVIAVWYFMPVRPVTACCLCGLVIWAANADCHCGLALWPAAVAYCRDLLLLLATVDVFHHFGLAPGTGKSSLHSDFALLAVTAACDTGFLLRLSLVCHYSLLMVFVS